MSTTQTVRRLPPTQRTEITEPMRYWELETQQAAPLRSVDTTAGPYTEAPPPAGLNATTGQTAQNQEITYVKTSSDANSFTLAGPNLPLGPYTLTAHGDFLKIKSDASNWWRVAHS